MNYNLKRVLAILFVVIIVGGWYLTIVGAGPIDPLKDRMKLGLDIKGGVYVVMEAKTDLKGDELREAMEQTQAVIEERVNQMGLAEPVVTIEGEKRIRVELPGAEDAEEAINQIGKTAQLQFALADGTMVLDGSNVKDASVTTDQDSAGYAVALDFDSEGGDLFYQATVKAYSGQVTSAIEGIPNNAIIILLDDKIISYPSVDNGPISGGSCSITGNFSKDEASNLSALINGGALPLELEEVNSSVQSAKIGYNALEMSVYAGLIGLALIMIIMLVAYRGMGVAADLALLFYIIIVLNIMSLMGSVLTLPGIAGIILSVGMAVDANVIIFSRIREEMTSGKTIRVACQAGFKRAMGTVIDSQITTLIAAVILYEIGTSSVKGFAWTFMIGIVISIFTAVVITQLYIGIMSESKVFAKKGLFGIKADNTTTFQIKKDLHFIKYRKIFYVVSIVILVVGLVFGLVRGLNYGIDFTGGTMIQMDMGKKVETSQVADSIKKYKLDPEIIYSGENNDQIVIRSIKSLDSSERTEVIGTLNQEFGTTEDDVVAQELFGPSVGKELRNNAILAIILAAAFMFIYIRLRFSQWKFGGAALLGVLHDVLIVIAFYAIFNVTVNNPFIAGILTVVGYSINDTIVVFDRIRENIRFKRSGNSEQLIDKSITQTLGRSLMTSFTTLVVMIPLLLMAGDAIREFVVPLMVGIIAGAYSSIAVCSPLYYEFNKPGSLSKYEKQVKATQKSKKKLNKPEEATEKIVEDAQPEEVAKQDTAPEETGEEPKKVVEKKIDSNQKRSKRYVKGNKN
ncbi:MAG: protein translocase subunit SecF [Clostridiales bacterium]|nr:protein translocase subunit SecF [Clostridiales bacterium]